MASTSGPADLDRRIYIGTSGWSYKGWQNTFYPPRLKAGDHLPFYASQFRTVEINLTFYRLPTPQMVIGWRAKVPEGFVYAVKGSRFITHLRKLTRVGDSLAQFFDCIGPLKNRVGPILWQLPPSLTKDVPRLRAFLRQLPSSYSAAIEFRHPSWLSPEVFDLLRGFRVAHVSVSSLAMPMNLTVTADFVYIRFHGLQGGAAHDYTADELRPWSEHIRRQADAGRTVYAFFNNDWNARAPANARTLAAEFGALRSVFSSAPLPL